MQSLRDLPVLECDICEPGGDFGINIYVCVLTQVNAPRDATRIMKCTFEVAFATAGRCGYYCCKQFETSINQKEIIMKKSCTSISKVLLTGVLVTGVGIISSAVSAQPADSSVGGYADSSDTALIAAANLKGKPPYNRHTKNKKPLEKARFARFEEKPGVAKDGHKSKYHGVQGKRPPFSRN